MAASWRDAIPQGAKNYPLAPLVALGSTVTLIARTGAAPPISALPPRRRQEREYVPADG